MKFKCIILGQYFFDTCINLICLYRRGTEYPFKKSHLKKTRTISPPTPLFSDILDPLEYSLFIWNISLWKCKKFRFWFDIFDRVKFLRVCYVCILMWPLIFRLCVIESYWSLWYRIMPILMVIYYLLFPANFNQSSPDPGPFIFKSKKITRIWFTSNWTYFVFCFYLIN